MAGDGDVNFHSLTSHTCCSWNLLSLPPLSFCRIRSPPVPCLLTRRFASSSTIFPYLFPFPCTQWVQAKGMAGKNFYPVICQSSSPLVRTVSPFCLHPFFFSSCSFPAWCIFSNFSPVFLDQQGKRWQEEGEQKWGGQQFFLFPALRHFIVIVKVNEDNAHHLTCALSRVPYFCMQTLIQYPPVFLLLQLCISCICISSNPDPPCVSLIHSRQRHTHHITSPFLSSIPISSLSWCAKC